MGGAIAWISIRRKTRATITMGTHLSFFAMSQVGETRCLLIANSTVMGTAKRDGRMNGDCGGVVPSLSASSSSSFIGVAAAAATTLLLTLTLVFVGTSATKTTTGLYSNGGKPRMTTFNSIISELRLSLTTDKLSSGDLDFRCPTIPRAKPVSTLSRKATHNYHSMQLGLTGYTKFFESLSKNVINSFFRDI